MHELNSRLRVHVHSNIDDKMGTDNIARGW